MLKNVYNKSNFSDMIEYFLENLNHRRPEPFQICQFQGHNIISLKYFIWILNIIIEDISPSI